MFKTVEEEPIQALVRLIWRLFGDAWFVMLASGALGNQLHVVFLINISYWNSWLVCFILQALWPTQNIPKLRIK